MKKFIYSFLLLAILATSCTVRTSYMQSGAKEYAPIDFEKVKIFSGIPKDLKYEVLASVSVNSTSSTKAIKTIKKEAAEMGADAVIDIKLNVLSSTDSRCGISGVAVKIK